MTGSQIDQPQTEQNSKEEAKLNRATRILLLGGIFNITSGIIQQLVNVSSDLPPFLFQMTIITGLIVLGSAYLIHKRRLMLGTLLFLLSAPPIIIYLISVNSGIGVLVTLAALLLLILVIPLVLTDARMIAQAQIGMVVGAVLIVFLDLFWPLERQPVDDGFLYTSVVILALLIAVFGYQTWRQFPEFGLRGKLISTTLVVAVMAVAVVAFGVNGFTRAALTDKAGEQLSTLVEAQSALVGELLFREVTALQALSLSNSLLDQLQERNAAYTGSDAEIAAQVQALDAAWQAASNTDSLVTAVINSPLAEELRQFRANFPDNSTFIVADQYGALLATTEKSERYDFTGTQWWQDAYAFGFGTMAFGEPFVNSRNGQTYIGISVPLYTRQATGGKQFAGILYSAYSLSGLEDLLVETQYGETGETRLHLPGFEMVIDENDKLVFLDESSFTSESEMAIFLDEEADFAFIEQGGETVLSAGHLITTLNRQPIVDDLSWLITVQQTEREALAAVDEQTRLNILLGVLVLIVTGGTAAVVGRRLTEPIVQLTAVAEKLTAGDLTANAEIQSQDEIGTLAQAFNVMAGQVSDLIGSLEQRVQSRTRALETSIVVGQRISTLLDLEELVTAVVVQIQEAFNYYHAHIYLIDEKDNNILRMAGGTGEAGQILLARNHQLTLDRGLVGRAASDMLPVLVPDVTADPSWLPNELLPDTKAEVAVPIVTGDTVFGVLDVQHNVVNGLGEEDVEMLRLIANQVAIAYQNARNFMQQQQQAAFEGRLNEIQQQIQQTTTVDEALQVTIRELGRQLGATKTMVKMNGGHTNGHN